MLLAILVLGLLLLGTMKEAWLPLGGTAGKVGARGGMYRLARAGTRGCPATAATSCLPPPPLPALSRLLQSSQRPARLETNYDTVEEAAAEGPPAAQKKQKQQAKPELTEAIKRRCEGTLGTWCVDYHTQLPAPAVPAPRGNKTCSLNCNKVCEQRGV